MWKMCKQCHSQFTDEQIIAQLEISQKDPQYGKWNETSISHMVICASGHNGPKAKEMSIALLRGFIEYASVDGAELENFWSKLSKENLTELSKALDQVEKEKIP